MTAWRWRWIRARHRGSISSGRPSTGSRRAGPGRGLFAPAARGGGGRLRLVAGRGRGDAVLGPGGASPAPRREPARLLLVPALPGERLRAQSADARPLPVLRYGADVLPQRRRQRLYGEDTAGVLRQPAHPAAAALPRAAGAGGGAGCLRAGRLLAD